jgi:hypothetical protein
MTPVPLPVRPLPQQRALTATRPTKSAGINLVTSFHSSCVDPCSLGRIASKGDVYGLAENDPQLSWAAVLLPSTVAFERAPVGRLRRSLIKACQYRWVQAVWVKDEARLLLK